MYAPYVGFRRGIYYVGEYEAGVFVGKGVANIGHGLGVGIKICSVQESYRVACACFDTLVDGVVAAARFSAYNPAAASLGLGENSFSFRCVAAAVHYYMLEFHSLR